MVQPLPIKHFLLSFFLSVFFTLSFAQKGTITGTVSDEKKEPLMGATVYVKGLSIGTATDMDGKYIIKDVPAGKQKLVVSYIGYTPKEIPVDVIIGDEAVVNVSMKEDAALLNEVVVVGYGTQVKKEVSSAIATVKAEDLANQEVYNFASGLQGKAAGVQITTDNGAAGAATTVRIRGTKSLSNSAEPLYVVDGVPIVVNDISNASSNGYNLSPLSTINPDDIESVDILKDAAATAIYGARGANGVMVITTKKGKEGKTRVDFSYSGGISTPTNLVKLLDGPQYAELYNEAWRNDGNSGNALLPNGINRDSIANTNWLKQVLRTGYFNDANFSMAGGNAKTNFYVGMGLRDEQSFLAGNKFQRASLRANISHEMNRYFSFGVNTSITRTDNQYVRVSGSGGLGAAQSTMLPIYPVYYNDGSYFLGNQNPVAQIELQKDRGISYRSISNVFATLNITKDLSFRNEFGFDMINQLEDFYQPREITGDSAIASDRRIYYLTWNYNSTLNYKKDFNDNHSFEALVGFNPTRTTEKFSYIQQKGFAVSSITQPNGGLVIQSAVAGTGKDYAFVSFFARVNYKLFNRYLIQGSIRSDGSSRFSPSKRFGYFPAVSLAWIISEEKFLRKKQETLSFLKLRLSVGTTGNAEFSDDFAYLSGYTAGQNYGGQSGIGPSNISVTNLGWETTIKTDFGVDFSLWDGRLSGLFDIYYESTRNMLVQGAPLTPSSGFSSVTKNIGSLYNRGLEIQLTSNNLGPKSKFKWKTIVNYGMNQNRITNLGGVAEVSGTNFGDNRAIVGQPVGVWMLAKYAGVDPESGQPLIYDFDGNKIVADATTTVKYRQPSGRPYPIFSGGLKNTFSYKGLELDVFFTFSYGNSIYDDHGKRSIGNMGFGWNQDSRTLSRWQQSGDITDVPKLSLTKNYDFNTTHYLYDASYLRLRTLTLSYSLDSKVTAKMKMRLFKIFVSAQNLATFTNYKGWDPETNRNGSGSITQGVSYLNVPQARIISAGINFGF